jgi:hypothetical protein
MFKKQAKRAFHHGRSFTLVPPPPASYATGLSRGHWHKAVASSG